MNDCYMHLDDNVMYIEESIPGPQESGKEYEELQTAFNSQLSKFCTCVDRCTKDCVCIKNSGGPNYTADEDGNLQLCELKDYKTHSIIECNSLCKCPSKCGNRVVQHGPIEGLFVQACQPKGLGLFTKNPIFKGSFICEYAGEIITKREALKRNHINKAKRKMNYIYCLNEHIKDRVIQTFVDPCNFGNLGRYMNHSCAANCIVIPVRVNSPIPKLAIFSQKIIAANNELTFDYGPADIETAGTVTGNRKECLCYSENCKGWLPFHEY